MQGTEQDHEDISYSAETCRLVRDTGFHRYMETYFCKMDCGDEVERSHFVAIKVVTRKHRAFVFSEC